MNLQKEVDTMLVQLIELQMCQLKPQRQVKRSTNQKRKLNFVRKKISGWKSDFSLLIFFFFLINNFASLKLKCALLFLGFFSEKIERLFFRNLKLLHSCLFLIFCNINFFFFLKEFSAPWLSYFCHIPYDGYIIRENFLLVSPLRQFPLIHSWRVNPKHFHLPKSNMFRMSNDAFVDG